MYPTVLASLSFEQGSSVPTRLSSVMSACSVGSLKASTADFATWFCTLENASNSLAVIFLSRRRWREIYWMKLSANISPVHTYLVPFLNHPNRSNRMSLCWVAATFVQTIVTTVGICRTHKVLSIMKVLKDHVPRILFLAVLVHSVGYIGITFSCSCECLFG